MTVYCLGEFTDLEEWIMAHERFRVGTTKGGPMLPDIDFEARQAVRAGNLVFLVGLTGFDRDTMEFAGAGDPAAQAEKAMENARALLEEAGRGKCLFRHTTST